jgi:hypothetical protein
MHTKNAACNMPMITHFIRVSARVPALISVVCGDEHAAAIISYTNPAATIKVIALDEPTIDMSAIVYFFAGVFVAGFFAGIVPVEVIVPFFIAVFSS